MTQSTVAPVDRIVTVGVDTHSDIHVAVALDQLGRRLGTISISTTPEGYQQLEAWAKELGALEAFGIEGTGSWGAGLVRHLREHGHRLVEVNRPDRGTRHRQGKNDSIDAEAAARAVLAGAATAQPKAGEGDVEMIRSLQLVRRSAQKARSQAANQLRALLVTAPADLREQLRSLTLAELVRLASRWRTGACPNTHLLVTKHALRSLARRYQELTEEIRDLDAQLTRLVQQAAPQLLAVKGLGPLTSAALLVAVGDQPDRMRSESAFAHLCGLHCQLRPVRPTATGSTAVATARPTTPSTFSPSPAWRGIHEPVPTWPNGRPTARRQRRSFAASSGTSPERSIGCSPHPPPCRRLLDGHRSFGKIERFHRTLADGWAFARMFTTESARRKALPA